MLGVTEWSVDVSRPDRRYNLHFIDSICLPGYSSKTLVDILLVSGAAFSRAPFPATAGVVFKVLTVGSPPRAQQTRATENRTTPSTRVTVWYHGRCSSRVDQFAATYCVFMDLFAKHAFL